MAKSSVLADLLITLLGCVCLTESVRYEPNWASLDARPLPSWYDEGKFGIFVNWGVYSVPSFGSEWFWWYWQGVHKPAYVDFMKQNYPPDFTYADFAPMFKAEFFQPNEWADIIKASGARYAVFSTKHHEGFTMWPSKNSWNWNAMDVGPHRDLIGELAVAFRKRTNVHFGLYHSMFEWFNPLFLQDKANNFTTNNFVKDKTMPELRDIVESYKPDIVWSDGDQGANYTYWNSTNFLAWLYNDSPVKNTVVVNDRWGSGMACHHGGFYTCTDRYSPGVLQKHKWENAMTIDKYSWGFRRNARLADFLTTDTLIGLLAKTVSCGGNMLMNIAPTADGIISPFFEERLFDMGGWLKVNGEAIYATHPWTHQNDSVTPRVWYTSKKVASQTAVYAIIQDWPKNASLFLQDVNPIFTTEVSLLGYAGLFDWAEGFTGGIVIQIPPIPANQMPCRFSWVFKFVGL